MFLNMKCLNQCLTTNNQIMCNLCEGTRCFHANEGYSIFTLYGKHFGSWTSFGPKFLEGRIKSDDKNLASYIGLSLVSQVSLIQYLTFERARQRRWRSDLTFSEVGSRFGIWSWILHIKTNVEFLLSCVFEIFVSF